MVSLFQHHVFSCTTVSTPARRPPPASSRSNPAFCRKRLRIGTSPPQIRPRSPPCPLASRPQARSKTGNTAHSGGEKKRSRSATNREVLHSEMDPAHLVKNPGAMLNAKAMNGVLAVPASQPPLAAAAAAAAAAAPPATTTAIQKMSPPSIAPRLEAQPYHEALKGSLTKENWMAYTEALNKFLRGMYAGAQGGYHSAFRMLTKPGRCCREAERCRTCRGDWRIHKGTKSSAA